MTRNELSPGRFLPGLIILCGLVRGWSSRRIGQCQWPSEPEGIVGDESRSNNTEIEVDDEDIHIRRKFRSCYGTGSRAKDQPYDDDPDSDDDASGQ